MIESTGTRTGITRDPFPRPGGEEALEVFGFFPLAYLESSAELGLADLRGASAFLECDLLKVCFESGGLRNKRASWNAIGRSHTSNYCDRRQHAWIHGA